MPPLLTSDIVDRPAVNKSPHRMVPVISKPPPPKGRQYGDEPLPYKPSEVAPRKATIKGRVALADSVAYTLDLAGVEIEDVGIDEILDYVSALELEQYENRQFEEEREIRRIAALEREAERERRKHRAKTKGIVIYQTASEPESGEGEEEGEEEVETGRHGRARPSYAHLYKVPELKGPKVRQRKRRRKRHPVTGELMPLSDEEDEAFVVPSKTAAASTRSPAAPAAELPKRRRRKRDPVTGELLPLAPLPTSSEQGLGEKAKRPRRRRHPVTGELMPLGWRYDPNETQPTYEQRREGGGGGGDRIPSINRLSIAREHDAKRVKLTSEEPSSEDELSPSNQLAKFTKRAVSESDSLRDSSSQDPPMSASKAKQTPKYSMLQAVSQDKSRAKQPSSTEESSSGPRITLATFLNSSKRDEDAESSSDESSSVEEKHVKSRAKTPGKTSIMNPVAAQTEDESEEDDEDDELGEGEWFVEAIRDHRLSDPRSHGGTKQVMLYKTKWEGYDELTWEPVESFVDRSVVDEYRKRRGLDRPTKAVKTEAVPTPKKKSATPAPAPKPKASGPTVIDLSDDEEEEGYEVEAILAHHMSDPRTHPGKPRTMLYKVKWVGSKETTWEPRAMFDDKTIVRQYEKSKGMHVEEDDESDDSDVEMET